MHRTSARRVRTQWSQRAWSRRPRGSRAPRYREEPDRALRWAASRCRRQWWSDCAKELPMSDD
eukprot:3989688-Prymnesium_polylepis.1